MRRKRLFLVLASALFFLIISGFSLQSESKESVEAKNIVIIDTAFMRADHLPCYGYHRNTTPNICEFSKESTVFTNAFSQAGWTHPSVGTLFTSQYPKVHGLKESNTTLHNSSETIAEVLNEKGYNTVAFPGLSQAARGSNKYHHEYQLLPRYGLYSGFDSYTVEGPFLSDNVPKAINWIKQNSSSSFFMYLQGYDPINYKAPGYYVGSHEKWNRFDKEYDGVLHQDEVMQKTSSLSESIVEKEGGPVLRLKNGTEIPLSERDIRHVISHYDSGLYMADKRIGKFLDVLKERDMMNDTIVVIQSSHGVYLNDTYEHMMHITNSEGKVGNRIFGHSGVTEAEIHVPLIIHSPDRKNGKIEHPVGLIDVMPTVLEAANIDISNLKDQIQGSNIFLSKNKEGPVFSTGGWSFHSVRTDNYKLIVHRNKPENLFSIQNATVRRTESSRIEQKLSQYFESWRMKNLDLASHLKE